MNIFILMYNFPPIGAGRGIAWTKFCSKLSEKYNVTVFTIDPSETDPLFNFSKFDLITNEYKVIRTNPGFLYKKIYPRKKERLSKTEDGKRKKRTTKVLLKKFYTVFFKNIFFPDRMILWNKYLWKAVLKESKFQKPNLIISVGFPFSTHLLAAKLKANFETKLILDYGDPWFFNPSKETIPPFRRRLDKLVEYKVIKKADFITVTTRETLNKYVESFPELENKIDVVSQGVDTSIYRDTKKVSIEEVLNKKVITMFYSGLFYEDIRNPITFFKALQNFDIYKKFGIKMRIIIAGKMEQYVIDAANLVNNEYIEIVFLGNINFSQVVDYQKKSDILLFFGNLGSVQVPGKIFEYLATNRPIFSVGDKNDYSTKLIIENERGMVSSYNQHEILKNLQLFLSSYIYGEFTHMKIVYEFDWDLLSSKYLKIVEEIMEDF